MGEADAEIDFDHLNQYVGGDVALTHEVFGLFKNQVDMLGNKLDPHSPDEVWEAVTHSLKGTARAIGAVRLADLCQTAEDLVGDAKRPGARDVIARKIEDGISQAMIEIQRWEYRQTLNKMRS